MLLCHRVDGMKIHINHFVCWQQVESKTATIDQASDPYGGLGGLFGRCIRYYYGACFTGCDFAGARYEL